MTNTYMNLHKVVLTVDIYMPLVRQYMKIEASYFEQQQQTFILV